MNRVLFVEDDPEDMDLTISAMERITPGLSAALAADGADAIEYLERVADRPEDHPLAIVLDLGLPRVGGFELLRWIRARREFDAVPVIVVSGVDLPERRAEALKLGAQGFQAKPAGFEDFRFLLGEVRRLSHIAQALRRAQDSEGPA